MIPASLRLQGWRTVADRFASRKTDVFRSGAIQFKTRQKGRRQKAESRKQRFERRGLSSNRKAEGRKQKAEVRAPRVELKSPNANAKRSMHFADRLGNVDSQE